MSGCSLPHRCFVQDIRYVHCVLVQLKLSIKERNTGLKRLRMCMLLGCQYQVATKECKSRCFKGVKEFRSVTRIFQSRGSICQTKGTRQIVMSTSTLCFTRSDQKKSLWREVTGSPFPPPFPFYALESLIKLQDKTVNRHNWVNFEFEKS